MQIRCKPAGLEDQDSKTESRFSPKIMQIQCKQGGLEDEDSKTEFWVSPKIMLKHSKPGSLEGQGPKSKISKINFTSWIRGFCRHLYTFVSSCFLKDQDPKIEPGFSPKIMQIRCKPGSLEDNDNKAESGLSSKIMQKHSKLGSLEDQGPKSKISKINFASWIRSFWRHVCHPFFWRIRIQKLNLDLVPRSCKYAVNQLVWRIRIRKLNLDLVPRSCK